MTQELTILKLGGSLLTDKTTPFTIREDVLRSAAQEIKECLDGGLIQSLVLIHGVGSYGHPLVLKHQLHKGFQSPEQILPLTKTQEKVNELRHIIVKQFHELDIPTVLLHPSSMVTSAKMKMNNYFLEALK
ncbi:MAG: amino acid kinase family protein, partial [Candidatus Thorarchaeota archaeon]